MKLTSEMKNMDCKTPRRRTLAYDKEFYRTYESELTLSEKGKKNVLTSDVSEAKSKTEIKEDSNVQSYLWLVGIVATLAVFSNSYTGKENIKRIITDCGRPPAIQFGSIIIDNEEGTKYGAKASVTCTIGYSSSRSETFCQSNGKWSSVYCHVTDCGKALPTIQNGHATLNKQGDSTYGATATVVCAPGYKRNKDRITCQQDGRWAEAECIPADCGVPEIGHGRLIFKETSYMSEAIVNCEPGYAPSQPVISCKATGLWQTAECYNVDECSPNPCLHGGECIDKINDFSCQCKQWYSGKTCQIDSRPCKNHQCRNGATCNDIPGGGYTCTCNVGWDGVFCESKHHY